MANISTLTVSLVAETAKFENGLRKSQSATKKFAAAASKAFNTAAIGVGVLTAGLVGLTKQSLATVDAQRKLARTLGTSQAVLSGLSLAAGISGVSVESFNKALKRQQKSIQDANDGLSTQKRAFDRLGLSTQELLKLPVEKQFAAITTALGKIESTTTRVAAASDIFGAKNADLINVLELGEKGIEQFIAKADELGVALTDTQTNNIEAANDALLVMKTAFTGLGNQVAAVVAPSIIAFAGTVEKLVKQITDALPLFTSWLEKLTGIRREINNLTLVEVETAFAVLTDQAREAREEVERLRRQADPFDLEGSTSGGLLQVRINELKEIEQRLNELTERRKDLLAKGEIATGAPINIEGTTASIGASIDTKGEAKRVDEQFSGIRAILQNMQGDFDAWKQSAETAFNATRTPLENFQIELQRIRDELVANPFADDELVQRSTEQAVAAYLAQMEVMKNGTKDATDEIKVFAEQAGRNMQDAFADFLFDPFDDGLQGMVKSFANTLRRMVADLLASQLLNGFFQLFPGVGNFFGLGSTPGRAIGGRVTPGGFFNVGERGPEVFTPGASGAVRPLGAVSVNSTLNINGGGDLNAASLLPILEENNRKVKAELLDEFDRGAFV